MRAPRLAACVLLIAVSLIGLSPLGGQPRLTPEAAGAAPAVLVDAVVGVVGSTVMSASDIGLARALSLFGFAPSAEPIRQEDVTRYGSALVAVLEASRLGIGPTLTEVDQAWREVETRAGSAEALRGWLEATAIDPDWVRRALEAHLRWKAWTALHEGLAIETPGATPEPPPIDSEFTVRNFLAPPNAVSVTVPFPMPPRPHP
jgi:hypothetical protein